MRTTANKGYAVGATVSLTEDYVSLFELPGFRNVICEVVDVRRVVGCYVYTVAPVGDRERTVEVYASDVAEVRS